MIWLAIGRLHSIQDLKSGLDYSLRKYPEYSRTVLEYAAYSWDYSTLTRSRITRGVGYGESGERLRHEFGGKLWAWSQVSPVWEGETVAKTLNQPPKRDKQWRDSSRAVPTRSAEEEPGKRSPECRGLSLAPSRVNRHPQLICDECVVVAHAVNEAWRSCGGKTDESVETTHCSMWSRR